MKKEFKLVKEISKAADETCLEALTGYSMDAGYTENAVKYIDADGVCRITMTADLFKELFGFSVMLKEAFNLCMNDNAMRLYTVKQRAFAHYFNQVVNEKAVREAHAIYCMRPFCDEREKAP